MKARPALLACLLVFSSSVCAASAGHLRTIQVLVPADADAITARVAALVKEAARNDTYLVSLEVVHDPRLTTREAVSRLNAAPADGTRLLMLSRRWKERVRPGDALVPVNRLAAVPFFVLGPGHTVGYTLDELIHRSKKAAGRVTVGIAQHDPLIPAALDFLTRTKGLGFRAVAPHPAVSPVRAVMARQVEVALDETHTALPFVRARQVAALATTAGQRLSAAPTVAAAGEIAPGYELVNWIAVFASGLTPFSRLEALHRHINSLLAVPAVSVRLAHMGLIGKPIGREEFAQYIENESSMTGAAAHLAPHVRW